MPSISEPLVQLHREHKERELYRIQVKAPIIVSTALILIGAVLVFAFWAPHARVPGITVGICLALAGILWALAAQLLAEWDRAVVLRLGHYRTIKGPGFFMIIPLFDSVMRIVDTRIRTTTFYSESTITKDTVPVGIDAIAFWHVWDAKKAVLEVERYYDAIVLAVQTALRDIIGTHTLAEILSERDKIGATLRKVLEAKTEAWGITVNSIEIRDITIPEELKDALSKQAQAERERQSRNILGEAEKEIAQKFVEASQGYKDNPIAIQLRAMNILYEGLRMGGSLMLVPSSILDTMNLGSLAAFGAQSQQKHAAAGPRHIGPTDIAGGA